jgi:uncharacterized iron-regulated membrane protein
VAIRGKLRRWHIWLGWIVALPLLLWTVSGVVMVIRPIEEVRGADLMAAAPALPSGIAAVAPPIGPRPIASLSLQPRPGGAVWVVRFADGATRLADAATGRFLPPLRAVDAAKIVSERYRGTSELASVDRTTAEAPPLDLRRPVAAWRVTMRDGVRFYLDAESGELLATRTPFWRFYDFMWGLHIMDPGGREDSHNPFVIVLGIVTLATTLMAIVLLPMTLRRRSR